MGKQRDNLHCAAATRDYRHRLIKDIARHCVQEVPHRFSDTITQDLEGQTLFSKHQALAEDLPAFPFAQSTCVNITPDLVSSGETQCVPGPEALMVGLSLGIVLLELLKKFQASLVNREREG